MKKRSKYDWELGFKHYHTWHLLDYVREKRTIGERDICHVFAVQYVLIDQANLNALGLESGLIILYFLHGTWQSCLHWQHTSQVLFIKITLSSSIEAHVSPRVFR